VVFLVEPLRLRLEAFFHAVFILDTTLRSLVPSRTAATGSWIAGATMIPPRQVGDMYLYTGSRPGGVFPYYRLLSRYTAAQEYSSGAVFHSQLVPTAGFWHPAREKRIACEDWTPAECAG
jgi:hypothetical protein